MIIHGEFVGENSEELFITKEIDILTETVFTTTY